MSRGIAVKGNHVDPSQLLSLGTTLEKFIHLENRWHHYLIGLSKVCN